MEKDRERDDWSREKTGAERRAVWELEGGSISSNSTIDILFPFSASIYLPASTLPCACFTAGEGPVRPSRAVQAYPRI